VRAALALERLYRESSNFEQLLAVLERRRELSDDPSQQRAISYDIADLFDTQLHDSERAARTYEDVLAVAPTDARALRALDSLYARLERWPAYADILRRRIDVETDEAQRVDLKYRLGQTLESRADDVGGGGKK